MIKITDKSKCCGCSACYNICPENAVSMQEDSEGFLYPKVLESYCIKCGLCIKVCPIINNRKDTEIFEIYGAKNKNIQEQKLSSSGGIFSLLANHILENNGIVFGAAHNDKWEVIHRFIDNKKDLDSLRRSKYVQSDIGNTYKQAKAFLEQNKTILFSGTPCQIAGLKVFLDKSYDKLYCMDFICHSVPSPKVWRMFLKQNFHLNDIMDINFRDKEIAWNRFYLKFYLKKHKTFPGQPLYVRKLILFFDKIGVQYFFNKIYYVSFFRAFLLSLINRPSCHSCSFKEKKKQSDITVGDLWGIFDIVPELYDKNGVSVVTVNSQKGKFLFDATKSNLTYTTVKFEKIVKYNPYFTTSVKANKKRQEFFNNYQTEPLNNLINRLLHKPFFKRFLSFLKNHLKR